MFCVNYNTTSDKLVSGCCDSDIKIWDVAEGKFRPLWLALEVVEPIELSREVFDDPSWAFRLRYCRAFQPGRQPGRFMRLRWVDVSRRKYPLFTVPQPMPIQQPHLELYDRRMRQDPRRR